METIRRKKPSGIRRALLVMLAAALITPLLSLTSPSTAHAAESYLLSQNRTAYASSTESGMTPNQAVDGNTGTRWSSVWGSDNEWIYVDLGAQATIDRVRIHWEGAYASAYKIQTSNDEMNWTDIYTVVNGAGGVDDLSIAGQGRFVRLLGLERALSAYGYSIFEFEVYGTGGINEPPLQYGPNVALNRPVVASSYEQSAYLPPNSTLPAHVADGNPSTRWSSNHTNNEWIYIDLGSKRTIGRIVLQWEAAGRAYDLEVSDNAQSWTPIYRELYGAGGKQDIGVYASGQYVRMKGISRATSFGYSLFEFEVYDYVPGHPQPTHSIPALPQRSIVQAGAGSYLTNDIGMPQPNYPRYKTSNINTPIASNDWWQSMLIKPLGDPIITLPLKSRFTPQGLSVLNPGTGWIDSAGNAVNADGPPDLYLMANNINTSKMSNRVTGYSDFAVDAVLSDDTTDKMKVTFVKGSPYVFTRFSDTNSVELYSSAITQITDGNGTPILATDGATFTGDRIGIRIENTDGSPQGTIQTRYYGLFVPPGTVFQKAGAKLKLQLGSGSNYVSLASLPSASALDFYYQHAYAFVTDTSVTYSYNPADASVTTNFEVQTQQMRSGFSNQTLLALYPHQWKYTTSPLTAYSYPSIRGTLKVREGNTFTSVDRFYGMIPQFTEPTNPEYSRAQMKEYLEILDEETSGNLMAADAYWQGKRLHPLAMGALAANEMGEISLRDKFLSRIKLILIDWYTYTDGEPDYFFYYDPHWGTMYYKTSEFGANYGITDHHFTYGYYVFASAVLATFDDGFRQDYEPMIDHLIRDYANPSDSDPLYPRFRAFDPYQGHSWAGGYADNPNGNNQEAAGESLFGWVGQYMWSLLTGDTGNRDAAIYGFTTELNAIEQYWFNYDGDNWLPEWTHKSVGQVYGSSYFYGTFFSGEDEHIYGIHWLPTSEYLTSYAFNKTKAAELYAGFVADNGGPETDWQHIIWPIQALSDPQAVLAKWQTTTMQRNEIFNTYWFVNSMASHGERTTDIWATGWSGASVYKKNGQYTAQIWNPTADTVTVTFRNSSGTTGTAVVGPKSLVSVNPMQNTTVADDWVEWDGGDGSNGENPGGEQPGVNLALNRTTTTSTVEGPFAGSYAVDGDLGTRWASEYSAAPQWIAVDLGSEKSISSIKLTWEAAYAKSYQIQFSNDGSNWNDAYSTTTGDGGIDEIMVSGNARHVRVYATERATPYGYSIYELEVYGGGSQPSESLLSQGKTADASSIEVPFAASLAFDGDSGTRWASQLGSDNEWISVDLEQARTLTRIELNWETAYGKSYKLQVSNDGSNWTDLYSTVAGTGGSESIPVSGNGRYVRLSATERGTPYGYSLYNFGVYGY